MLFLPPTLGAFRFLILCFVLFVSFFVIASSSGSSSSTVCLDGGRFLDGGITPRQSVVASKAYLSTVVFQGTLYRAVEERDGTIRAAYGVGKVLKSDDIDMSGAGSPVEIVYFQRQRTGKDCILPVTDQDLKLGSEYIVFGHPQGPFGIVATAFPEELSKKALRQVTKVLCNNCAKRAGIEGLRNIRLKERQKLRLQCHLKGNPIPWVKWFKDGQEIQGDRRIRVRTKRRSTKVVIRHVRRHDSGVYECRAGNVVDERGTFVKATVTVTAAKRTTTKPENETNATAPTLWPGEPCPIKDFCLNGGKCTFYRVVGEYVCECAEGYVGLRCHYKDVRVSVSKVKHFRSRGLIP